MAKAIVTYSKVGTTWNVHRDLIDSEGLAFVQDYLSGYDLSKISNIRLYHSAADYQPYEKEMPESETGEKRTLNTTCAYFGYCGPDTTGPRGNRTWSDTYHLDCNVVKDVSYPATDTRTAKTRFGKRKTRSKFSLRARPWLPSLLMRPRTTSGSPTRCRAAVERVPAPTPTEPRVSISPPMRLRPVYSPRLRLRLTA